MPITTIAALTATTLLTALAALQVLVAAGRPYGRVVWGGQHDVLPRRLRVGSAVSVLLYTVFAVLLLWRVGVFGPPGLVAYIAAWVPFAFSAAGIVLNAISRSHFERLVMTPTSALLAVCSLIVAIG